MIGIKKITAALHKMKMKTEISILLSIGQSQGTLHVGLEGNNGICNPYIP